VRAGGLIAARHVGKFSSPLLPVTLAVDRGEHAHAQVCRKPCPPIEPCLRPTEEMLLKPLTAGTHWESARRWPGESRLMDYLFASGMLTTRSALAEFGGYCCRLTGI